LIKFAFFLKLNCSVRQMLDVKPRNTVYTEDIRGTRDTD